MKDQYPPALERLVDEVLAGERIILLPPGWLSFILSQLLLLVGCVVLGGSLINSFGTDAAVTEKVSWQIAVLLMYLMVVLLPGLLVTKGLPRAALWVRVVSICVVLLSGALLITSLLWEESTLSFKPLLLSTVTTTSALFLQHTSYYQLFVGFFWLKRHKSRP